MKPLKALNDDVTDGENSNKTSISKSTRIIQNFLLVWLDTSIDEVNNRDTINTITELREVVNTVNKFTDDNECIQFITGIEKEKAFVIASGSLGQDLVPNIHDLPQVDAIYIFCGNKSRHEQWTKEWVKIKGLYNDIKSVCQALQQAAKQCNQDSIPMSFVPVSEEAPTQNLDQREPSFMYTQIFKEILLDMEHDEKSIKDLAIYCRQFYNDNIRELTVIGEFENGYPLKSPIWWYTRECFIYQMLNRALHTLEGDTIISMSFFIRDLHEQIQQLHQKQVDNYHGKSVTVYRGQGLLKTDFENLVKTKGGLMSFNNFLSTSTKREVSLDFAKNALTKTNMVGILFTMTIDPSVSSAPFASIREVSYYKTEEEILFSMHTVFRVDGINKMDNNDSLYQVDLKLTADVDQQLRTLTERIQEEAVSGTRCQQLAHSLAKLNQFDKAEELCNILLEQASDEGEKAPYYNDLGCIKVHQGDYEKATEYYEKALEIDQKTLPSNHPDLATAYKNIGLLYKNMGEYSKALSFCEKALEIRQKTLPPNHPSLATSYGNIGLVYNNMGEYLKALSFCEKALEIRQKTHPTNHPDLATAYGNIGLVYKNMGEYSKALSFLQKDIEIRQKTVLPNHPSLAPSYNNIGLMHMNMGEYSKALSFNEKALEIWEKTLPKNHPDLATTYGNIGLVYKNIGEYSKAVSFLQKDIEIRQNALPPNHPSLATSYNNIGCVYRSMSDYWKALAYFERALDIKQRSLPPNHPSIQSVLKNIEIVNKKLCTYF